MAIATGTGLALGALGTLGAGYLGARGASDANKANAANQAAYLAWQQQMYNNATPQARQDQFVSDYGLSHNMYLGEGQFAGQGTFDFSRQFNDQNLAFQNDYARQYIDLNQDLYRYANPEAAGLQQQLYANAANGVDGSSYVRDIYESMYGENGTATGGSGGGGGVPTAMLSGYQGGLPRFGQSTMDDGLTTVDSSALPEYLHGQYGNDSTNALRDLLESQLSENLASNGQLADWQSNIVNNSTRSAQGARGNVLGNSASFEEVLNSAEYADARAKQNRADTLEYLMSGETGWDVRNNIRMDSNNLFDRGFNNKLSLNAQNNATESQRLQNELSQIGFNNSASQQAFENAFGVQQYNDSVARQNAAEARAAASAGRSSANADIARQLQMAQYLDALNRGDSDTNWARQYQMAYTGDPSAAGQYQVNSQTNPFAAQFGGFDPLQSSAVGMGVSAPQGAAVNPWYQFGAQALGTLGGWAANQGWGTPNYGISGGAGAGAGTGAGAGANPWSTYGGTAYYSGQPVTIGG